MKTSAHARQVRIDGRFASWRVKARELLQAGVAPQDAAFLDDAGTHAPSLFSAPETETSAPAQDRQIRVPAEFMRRAKIVACHRDTERWNLLYRLLSRLQMSRDLLRVEVDDDVAAFRAMEIQVQRDLHKMHAFVRFRRVENADGEHFIAWYEPAHHVLELAAPFFAERFAVMCWSILTPEASASWNPQTRELIFGPGVPRAMAPKGDALEEMWGTYYKSIFNPARTNVTAMRAEMPVRYWKNLPEIALLPDLLQNAESRVEGMIAKQAASSAGPFVPPQHVLPVLQAAIPACQGCELHKYATQAVFGQGPPNAQLMLVGEQPGDEEDRRGEPFVGPAGRLLEELMAEAAIDRNTVYVTNAVKHFKFKERGKRRLHENPRLSEIFACRPWLLAEIDAVKPTVVVCLGASAARSLLGANFALTRNRGQVLSSPYTERVLATFHPSAILRAEAERSASYREMLVHDLRLAASLVRAV